MSHGRLASIDDLDNPVLIKILSLVLEPFDSEFECVSHSRNSREEEGSAGYIVGFEHFTSLPRVCRRWRNMINTTPDLWRYVRICCWGWPKQMSTLWWAKRASQIQGVALSGHTNWIGMDISSFNLGLLSLFGRQLRVLRLIKCFHRTFVSTALRALENLTGLEKLCIWGHVAYLNSATGLTSLSRLTSLVLRRCSSPEKILRLCCLPASVKQMSLENVEILPKELLRLKSLTDLTLSFSKWHGDLLACVSVLHMLENLIIHSSTSATEDSQQQLTGFHTLGHLVNLRCMKITVNSLEIPGTAFSAAHAVSSLVVLHLESYKFESVPVGIFELPLLEDLALNHGNLTYLPLEIHLSRLKILNLNCNGFVEVPAALESVTSLEILSMCGNPLKFTRDMDRLALLPNLVCLKLGWDQLHNDKRQLFDARYINTDSSVE